MTLIELIEELKKHDPAKVVRHGFLGPHSYRGDYSYLAFEPASKMSVGAMLLEAQSALGSTYAGYKGGSYKMNEYTPVYLAFYGSCGEELGPTLLRLMLDSKVEPDPPKAPGPVKPIRMVRVDVSLYVKVPFNTYADEVAMDEVQKLLNPKLNRINADSPLMDFFFDGPYSEYLDLDGVYSEGDYSDPTKVFAA